MLVEQAQACEVGGQQVRRELNALEPGVDDGGERFDREGFGQAGHTFQQDVAADEETGDYAFDDIFVADDDFFELLANPVVIAPKGVDLRFKLGCVGRAHGWVLDLVIENSGISELSMSYDLFSWSSQTLRLAASRRPV